MVIRIGDRLVALCECEIEPNPWQGHMVWSVKADPKEYE